jgi:predicted HTH transcriptional regulator|tara:strand:+ start:58 stop:318 length:261 start_codon:yes stop_codon:yes gene_type:complete
MKILALGAMLLVAGDMPHVITQCMEQRKMALDTYYELIEGIVPTTFLDENNNHKPYYVVTQEAMNQIHDRYNALVNYTSCLEAHSK